MTTTASTATAPLSELAHPLAVEIARHTCRAFASARAFHDRMFGIIIPRFEEFDDWSMMSGGLVRLDAGAEHACLDSLLGLRPVQHTADIKLIDHGNLGLVVDGVLYTLVYDRDELEEVLCESNRPSPKEKYSRGVYRVHAIPLDQVLGLEPDRAAGPDGTPRDDVQRRGRGRVARRLRAGLPRLHLGQAVAGGRHLPAGTERRGVRLHPARRAGGPAGELAERPDPRPLTPRVRGAGCPAPIPTLSRYKARRPTAMTTMPPTIAARPEDEGGPPCS